MTDEPDLTDLIERYTEFKTKFEVTLDADRKRAVWDELKPAYEELLKAAPDQVEPLPLRP